MAEQAVNRAARAVEFVDRQIRVDARHGSAEGQDQGFRSSVGSNFEAEVRPRFLREGTISLPQCFRTIEVRRETQIADNADDFQRSVLLDHFAVAGPDFLAERTFAWPK